MKLQILLREFGLFLILGLVAIIDISSGTTAHDRFIDITILVLCLLFAFLSDHKYLQHINIKDQQVSICYYTAFLQSKTLDLIPGEIDSLKLSDRPAIPLWTPTLRVYLKKMNIRFRVLSKKLYKQLEEELSSSPLAFH